jgi:hypothetical protein
MGRGKKRIKIETEQENQFVFTADFDNPCSVCLLTFAKGDVVLQLLPCLHLFHKNCVKNWWERQKSCPFCREKNKTKKIYI